MENKTNIKNINPEVYEAVLEALEDHAIVSVTDEKGDILWANNKFLELSKYSLDELVGQNHRILKSGHQPQELFVDLWATISAGKTWHGEVKNRAKDGTYFWASATIVPIFGPDGKIKNYAGLRILINKEKELEEKVLKRVNELEKFNKYSVDRELVMVELKKEIKELKEKLAKAEGK